MAAQTQRPTVKVKMLRETRGADDGITVVTYKAGQEYEIGESLAKAFVDDLKAAHRVTVVTAARDAVKSVAAKVMEIAAPVVEPAPEAVEVESLTPQPAEPPAEPKPDEPAARRARKSKD